MLRFYLGEEGRPYWLYIFDIRGFNKCLELVGLKLCSAMIKVEVLPAGLPCQS